MRIDPCGCTQSEPKQGFVLFELTPANEISLVDYYFGDFEEVLHRPLETTPVIVMWDLPIPSFRERPVYRESEKILAESQGSNRSNVS
jgi:hypothetical protein